MSSLARRLALGTALVLGLVAAPAAQAAPLPLTHQSTAVSDTPNDGVLAPGDELAILETVHNGGVSTLTGLSATLTSSTPGVTVTQGTVSYPDIAAGANGASAIPLRVQLSSAMPCGTTLSFTLAFTSLAGTVAVPFTVVTAYQGAYVDYDGNPAVIGDATPTLHAGLMVFNATASVPSSGVVKGVQVAIGDLAFTDTSELGIDLVAPDGSRANMIDHRGAGGTAFNDTELVPGASASLASGISPFTGTFHPDGDVTPLIGRSQQGLWKLAIDADELGHLGRLNRWTLRIAPADCTPRSYARLDVSAARVDPGAPVDLDASDSFSINGPVTGYEWDLGTGTFGAPTANPLRTEIFTRGRYTLRVRASDANGAVGVASQLLIVSQVPTAVIGLPGTPVKQGQYAALDGTGSSDPDGAAIAKYEWDVDGDNDFDDGLGPQPNIYFGDSGVQSIKLRVTDADGATGTTSTAMFVAPTTPPVAAIEANPNPVVAHEPVAFDGGASSDPDGTVVGYEWDLDGNGSFETSTGASPLAGRTYPNATVLSIGVRVTDNDGRTAVAQMPLTVHAAPGGSGGNGDPGGAGGAGGGSGPGGGGAGGGSGGAGGSGGGGGRPNPLGAALGGVAIQGLKLVGTKGLGLRCEADRAVTCTVTATLQPADARRLVLSTSKKKAFVLGTAKTKLKKAGTATVTVRLPSKVVKRIKRTRQVLIIVAGQAIDGTGAKVTLRRAVLLRS